MAAVEWKDTSAAEWKNTAAAIWRSHGLIPAVATDGIEFSDTTVPLAGFLAAITEGIDFSDTVAAVMTYLEELTDGLDFSDVAIPLAEFLAIATDGIKFSDSTLAAFVETLTEGFVLSDTTAAAFVGYITEGLEFSDTVLELATFRPIASDGIEFSDTTVPLATFRPIAVDGIVFSDTAAPVGVQFGVITEGIVFSDVAAPIGVQFGVITEGIEFSDTPAAAAIEALTEGLIFNDDPGEPIMTYPVTAADVIVFTDDDNLFIDYSTSGFGTFLDKWTKDDNNTGTSFPEYNNPWGIDAIRFQVASSASRSFGCNAQPIIPNLIKSGVYEVRFKYYSNQDWGNRDAISDNPDDGNNRETKIEITKPDASSKVSNDFYELEEGFAGVGAKLSLNLRTNYSSKITIREYFEGSPTILLNEDYTYNGTDGDNFIFRFDLTNKWAEVLDSNEEVIGSRVTLSQNFIDALADPFMFNFHYHGYASSGMVYYDDIEISRYHQSPWGRAIYRPISTDGIEFSDSNVSRAFLIGLAEDTIVFSEGELSALCTFHVTAADGIVWTDQTAAAFVETLTEGMVWGDGVIWIRPYDPWDIDVQPKGQSFTFKALAVLTNFKALKKHLDSGAVELMAADPIRIHQADTDFKAVAVVTDFKANKKDFNTEV